MGTPEGTYWIGAIADDLDQVGETDEANNITLFPDAIEVSAPPLPDLVPTGVTFSPPAIEAGETIQVDDAVENQGEANSGAFQLGIYLSTDTQVTTSDILLGVRQIVDLAPGSGDSGVGTVTVPQQTPPGIYYVGVIADDVDDVFEQAEVNNQLVAGNVLQVKQPPLPDLVPTELSFTPSSVQAGDTIYVTEGVLNQGAAPAASFLVSVYLSADPLVDSSDIVLGYRGVAFLGDGESDGVAVTPIEVPPDTPAGTYWVGVWVDDSGVVHESVEANNVLMAVGTLAVGVPPLPNLAPVVCTFSPSVINVDAAEFLNVVEEVQNNGAAPAGSFRVGVYLSTNSVVTPSDLLIQSRVITAMNPGVSSGASHDLQLPIGISDGSYYIGIFVDDLAQQAEISEGDNVLVATGTLDVVSSPNPEPDLIMQQCDYSGSKKAPGDTFQVVTKVTNEGDLSAPPFQVGIYLSDDAVISPDDVLLGERNLIGGLSAGFSSVSSAPVTIPAGQPEGTYYVGAYADNNLVVAESDEDDNDFTTPGVLVVEIPPPPAPELYVKSATHDGTTNDPGDVITFDEVVRNKGDVDVTSPFRVG